MPADNTMYFTIKGVVDYIEENLKNKITLDDIAANTKLSKFHLDRIFRSITYTRLMGYVRLRKLSSSVKELLDTDLKIIDISYEYGFGYEQSYIRAFEKCFGVSPDTFRREKPEIKIKDRINLDFVKAVGEKGIMLEPAIVIKPSFSLAGIKHRINIAEDAVCFKANEAGNDFITNHMQKIKNTVYRDIYIGLVQYISNQTEFIYYMPSVQVSGMPVLPQYMTFQTLPTRKYAVFKYVGLHHPKHTNTEYLYQTLNYIYAEWFPKSGYVQSDPYRLEMIDHRITRDDYCEVGIFIPVIMESKKDDFELYEQSIKIHPR